MALYVPYRTHNTFFFTYTTGYGDGHLAGLTEVPGTGM